MEHWTLDSLIRTTISEIKQIEKDNEIDSLDYDKNPRYIEFEVNAWCVDNISKKHKEIVIYDTDTERIKNKIKFSIRYD